MSNRTAILLLFVALVLPGFSASSPVWAQTEEAEEAEEVEATDETGEAEEPPPRRLSMAPT